MLLIDVLQNTTGNQGWEIGYFIISKKFNILLYKASWFTTVYNFYISTKDTCCHCYTILKIDVITFYTLILSDVILFIPAFCMLATVDGTAVCLRSTLHNTFHNISYPIMCKQTDGIRCSVNPNVRNFVRKYQLTCVHDIKS